MLYKTILTLILLTCYSAFAAEIKVVTWNLYLLPNIAKSTMQKERVKHIANYLENIDADIVMLQEAFPGFAYREIKAKMQKNFPYDTGKPKSRFYKVISSGLIIFSKFPISNINFRSYRNMSAADKWSSKGILHADIEVGDKTFRIANTHLQAQKGDKYERKRKEQLETIEKRALAHTTDGVIIGGDFNINTHNKKEFPTLESFLTRNQLKNSTFTNHEYVFTSDSTTNEVIQKFKPKKNAQRLIDYIFVSDSRFDVKEYYIFNPKTNYPLIDEDEKEDVYTLSDHYPVFARIEY